MMITIDTFRNKLEFYLIKNKISKKTLAEAIGMNYNVFIRKLNKGNFWVEEYIEIKQYFASIGLDVDPLNI